MRFEGTRGSPGGSSSPVFARSDTAVLKTRSSRLSDRNARSAEFQPYIQDFFRLEPCPYSHLVFQHAALVFDALKHVYNEDSQNQKPGKKGDCGKPAVVSKDVPSIDFNSKNDKRLTFQLVFQTLKYQRFLEDMLTDCSFFSQFPEFKEDTSLVMVALCDFKQRKFQRRPHQAEQETNLYICQIEEALFQCKTKLNAALARSRIKARVLSIDHLLPDSVRQNEKIGSNMHVYGWVNAIKSSLDAVLEQLRDENFVEVQSEGKLMGKSYLLDNQCTDMVCFPYDMREAIEQHNLVQDGCLVLQDKSSCVGPHSVRALINEGDDILHINIGSGITTAHLASLTHNSDTVVYAVGVQSEKQQKLAQRNIEQLGAKSRIKFIPDNILEMDYHDERLKHIKVILLTAECTRSGVANPVNFIVTEAEETSILRDLSLGYTDENKLGELVVKHNSILKHVLRFPRVQGVVYCSRSILEAENENVVTRSLEYVNMVQQKKTPYRIAPPVIPLSDRDIELENPLNGKYLRYPPSNMMSGCFVATITREADDPKEAAKDILAKAAARGIITGVNVQKEEKPHKSKSKSGRKRDKTEKSSKSGVNLSRKKSPLRSPTRPSKSKDSPSAARPTVGKRYSMLQFSPRIDQSDACRQTSPLHPHVFQASFLTYSQSTTTSTHRPRPRTPPHEKIIRHPLPFR